MATSDVMFRLRVRENDTQQDILYNGVSANTWLTPIGLTTYKPAVVRTPGISPDPNVAARTSYVNNVIAPSCAQTVQQRARSASAFLGRRHFEVADRQEFDESITGTGLKCRNKMNCNTQSYNMESNYFDDDYKSQFDYLNQDNNFDHPWLGIGEGGLVRASTATGKELRVSFRRDLVSYLDAPPGTTLNRPHTSVGEYGRGSGRPDLMECPAFVIQPLQAATSNKESNSVHQDQLHNQEDTEDLRTNFRSFKSALDKKLEHLGRTQEMTAHRRKSASRGSAKSIIIPRNR